MTVDVNVFAFAVTLCDLNDAPLFVALIETAPGPTLIRNAVPSVFVADRLAGVPLESEYMYFAAAGELETAAPATGMPLASRISATTMPLLVCWPV